MGCACTNDYNPEFWLWQRSVWPSGAGSGDYVEGGRYPADISALLPLYPGRGKSSIQHTREAYRKCRTAENRRDRRPQLSPPPFEWTPASWLIVVTLFLSRSELPHSCRSRETPECSLSALASWRNRFYPKPVSPPKTAVTSFFRFFYPPLTR